MRLSPEYLTVFLVVIGLMLLLGRLLGEFMTRLRQAAIIGEILAGIILGPTVLGMIAPGLEAWLFPQVPQIQYTLDAITSLAAVMMLLVSGMEVELSMVVRQGRTAFLTSITGVVIPFAIGFALAWAFPRLLGLREDTMRLPFALFMGTSMSISALPVIARTLMDLNIFKTELGLVIVAAAMFDDLTGWIIFSIVLGMIGHEVHGLRLGDKVSAVLGFVAVVLLLVRPALDRILPHVQRVFSFPGGVLTMIMVLGFLGAALTETIGIHAVFGAFILGVAIGDSQHLAERTREIIHQFVTNIFAPLFFVSIGLRVNFITSFDAAIVGIVLGVAVVGKVVGCGLGAWVGGMPRHEALAVGFGMNSRGAMEIILGLLALQYGVIQDRLFVALVVMALVTSLASAPLMNLALRHRPRSPVADLLVPDMVFFTDTTDRRQVLRGLADLAARKQGLDADDIYDEIQRQEERVSSGLGYGFALPHVKYAVSAPVVALAVARNGVDFNAPDGMTARLILLLLTPVHDVRAQFSLLAEIAHRLGIQSVVEQAVRAERPDDVVAILHRSLSSLASLTRE